MRPAYDVIIIGGGASGTALLYALSRYTDIGSIALLEKNAALGSVNSHPKNNSQTLHVGDIETNYSFEKARQVRTAALMVKRYTDSLEEDERASIIRKVQKMVLAVGKQEVDELGARYEHLKEIFPDLVRLDAEGIRAAEPEVMRGRGEEPVLALFSEEGYAVNFGALARSLASHAKSAAGDGRIDVLLGHEVLSLERDREDWKVWTNKGEARASVVVVDADAHSLRFAKRLGYGTHFSLIPIAGNFYFTKERLRGKVYRVQAKRMPFAAIHGDPDLTRDGATRWGPTARFFPVLEARALSTMGAFFATSGMHRISTWISFVSILLEPIRFWYLLKNFFYDLPIIGRYALLPQLRKIIPTITAGELEWARGYGGMRLQRVNTETRELLLGEGKIEGERILFNMTPSPGASVCLNNALRDAQFVVRSLPQFSFDEERMLQELCVTKEAPVGDDTSLEQSYAS